MYIYTYNRLINAAYVIFDCRTGTITSRKCREPLQTTAQRRLIHSWRGHDCKKNRCYNMLLSAFSDTIHIKQTWILTVREKERKMEIENKKWTAFLLTCGYMCFISSNDEKSNSIACKLVQFVVCVHLRSVLSLVCSNSDGKSSREKIRADSFLTCRRKALDVLQVIKGANNW